MKTTTMKKIGILVLSLVLLFALTACDNGGSDTTQPEEGTTVENVASVDDVFALGTSADDVIAGLPTTVEVEYADGSTVDEEVTWTARDNYDPEVEGEYVFDGTVSLSKGDAGTAETTATVELMKDDEESPVLKTASIYDNMPHAVIVEFDKTMDIASMIDMEPYMEVDSEIGFTIEVAGEEVNIGHAVPVPDDIEVLLEDRDDFIEQFQTGQFNLDKYIDGEYNVKEGYTAVSAPYWGYFVIVIDGVEYTPEEVFINYALDNYGGETSTVAFYVEDYDAKFEDGDEVTISYDASASGAKATDIFGNELQSFQDENVDNKIEDPVLDKAVIKDDEPGEITLEFSEDMGDVTSSGITVTGSETEERTVHSINYEDDPSVLTLDIAPVLAGETVTLSFDADNGDISDRYGNQLESIEDMTVENNSTAPEFVEAAVDTENPNELDVTFDEDVSQTADDARGFTVTVNDTVVDYASTASSDNTDDATVTLYLAEAVEAGDDVTVKYEKETGRVEDVDAGNPALSFGPETVTNDLEAPEAPAVETATATSINTIEVVFDRLVDNNTADLASLADEVTVMLGDTELSISGVSLDHDTTTEKTTMTVTLGYDLDTEYASGDATIEIAAEAVVDSNDAENYNEAITEDVADGIIPVLESVTATATDTLELVFTETVDFNISEADFRGKVADSTLNTTGGSAVVDGDTVTLTLDDSRTVAGDYTDTVYVDDDAVVDAAGNTNNDGSESAVDEINPEYVESVVENDAPYDVVVTFSEEMNAMNADGFTIMVDGTEATIDSVTDTVGTTETFTLANPVQAGETVTVAYDANATDANAEDTADTPNALESFTAKTVTNNVEKPEFDSVTATATEDAIELGYVYDDDSTATVTTASGSTLEAGDFLVTVNGTAVNITVTNASTLTVDGGLVAGDEVSVTIEAPEKIVDDMSLSPIDTDTDLTQTDTVE